MQSYKILLHDAKAILQPASEKRKEEKNMKKKNNTLKNLLKRSSDNEKNIFCLARSLIRSPA
jgi:cell shape-determining protein MreC